MNFINGELIGKVTSVPWSVIFPNVDIKGKINKNPNPLERKKKKTPGNGFAKMKCKEKIAELEAIFEKIDYAVQVTYD